MIVAVDFDGTLCKDEWPNIGAANGDLIQDLILARAEGMKIILWTCREGELLEQAVSWCQNHGLTFDAINENIPEVLERFGGSSRKIFADVYIDDKAVSTFPMSY